MGELGPLQQRAAAYGKLQSDIAFVRLLLPENLSPHDDFFTVWPGAAPIPLEGDARVAVDQAVANQVKRIAPETLPDRLGFVPPTEDENVLREIREKSVRLDAVMEELIPDSTDALRAQAMALAANLNQLASELTNATTALLVPPPARKLTSTSALSCRPSALIRVAWTRTSSPVWPPRLRTVIGR